MALSRSVIAVVVVIFIVMAANGVTATNAPAFRDLSWGDPVDALGGATFLQDDDGLMLYVRQDEEYTLGSVPIDGIIYGFFQNRLAALVISIPDFSRARTMLEAKYGRPYDDNRYTKEAKWIDGDTIVILSRDILTQKAAVTLGSISINREMQAWIKEQAAKDAAAW